MGRLIVVGCGLALGVALAACGETDGNELTQSGASSSGTGDNRYHPTPNGVRISEDAACNAVRGAIVARATELACVKSLPLCKAFIVSQYQPECMQYDQGSVQGCESYFAAVATCAELVEGDCVLTTYPETAPLGCP